MLLGMAFAHWRKISQHFSIGLAEIDSELVRLAATEMLRICAQGGGFR